MTEMRKIAEAYIAAWNETNADRRGKLMDAAFTPDISCRDPIMQGDGHEGIAALIDGVHGQFPGFRFALKGEPDGFADKVRFSWTLGPDGAEAPIEGTDVCVVAGGRLQQVTGFLNKVPAQ